LAIHHLFLVMTHLNLQPSVLENNLISLKPLTGQEFEALYEAASDPAIWAQHPSPTRYKREEFQQFYDSALASKSAFVVADKETGNIIGSTRFYDYKPDESSIAIGYTFLATKYWGGKYNQCMKQLLLDYAFQSVDSVFFHVGQSNMRSQKAVLKLGASMVREFICEQSASKSPYFEFELKKESWLKRMQNQALVS